MQSLSGLGVVFVLLMVPLAHYVGIHEETELPKQALSALLLGPLWLLYLLGGGRNLSFCVPTTLILLIGSSVWQLATLSESASPAQGVGPWLGSIQTILWFFLCLQVMESPKIRRWAVRALIVSASVAALLGLMQYGVEHPSRFPAGAWSEGLLEGWQVGVGQATGFLAGFFGNRLSQTVSPGSFFGHTNVAAEFVLLGFLAAVCFVGVYMAQWRESRRKVSLLRAGLLFLLTLMLGLFVLRTGSRAAVLAIAGAVAAFGLTWVLVRARNQPLFGSGRAHLLVAFLSVTALAGAGAVGLSAVRTAPRHGQTEVNGLERLLSSVDTRSDTVQERLVLWSNTAAMVESHPIYGAGIGNFPVAYPEFASSRRQHDVGRYSSRRQPEKPHNLYLHRVSEDGLGSILFLLPLLIVAGCALRRLCAAVLQPGTQSTRVASAMGIIAVLILGLVAFPLHGTGVRLAFWAMAAILLTGNNRVRVWRATPTMQAVLVVLAVAFTGLSAVHARSRIEASRSHLLAARNAYLASEVPAGRRSLLLDALRHADSAVRRAPMRFDYELQRADLLNRLGRAQDAEDSLHRSLRLHPNLINAEVGLVSLELADGRLQDADMRATRAVGLNPIDPRARLALAGTRAALGKTRAALVEYRRVLSLLPDPQTSLRCHINLALILDEIGDSVGATFHLREASRIAPSSAAGLEAQARILQRHAPASEQSELAWRRLLEVVPDHSEAHFRVGLSSLAKGRLDEALEQMNAALESDASLTVALFHRGEILARLNRLGEARDSLFECMKRCGVKGQDMPLWERSWALAQALEQRLREQEAREGDR